MIKKTIEKKPENTSVKIPTMGVIFFSSLLAVTSFSAGISWAKSRGTTSIINTASTTIPAASAKSTYTAQKSDTPEMKFFVMSFCPYGNQIETALRPVFDLLGKKANIKPQYIFEKIADLPTYCQKSSGDISQCATYVTNKYFTTEAECKTTITANIKSCQNESNYVKSPAGAFYASLHGRQEANQDVREICAWNMSNDKTAWWNFIGNVNQNCTAQNADSCWTDQAKSAGLDTNKITECFNNEGVNLIEKEIVESEKYKAYSSPTLISNGVNFPPEAAWVNDGSGNVAIGKLVFTQSQYRSPNTIKEALCASFNKIPSECKKELAQVSATNTAAAPAAGCGQ